MVLIDARTLETYEDSAQPLAEYFWRFNRIEDVERMLMMSPTSKPRIIELGSGPGREARILEGRCHEYVGIDFSAPMVEIAKRNAPYAEFVCGDIRRTEIPACDIILALDVLHHVSPEDLQVLLIRIFEQLSAKGIFYATFKEGTGEDRKIDQFGDRVQYFYTSEQIKDWTRYSATTVYEEHFEHCGSKRFTIALRKTPKRSSKAPM